MDIGTSKAAEMLGVTQKTVQEWCRAGKFKTATQEGGESRGIFLSRKSINL
mgnify:CR=1 FL=1